MKEYFAMRFVSHLGAEIQKELDRLYASVQTFPRVVLRPPLPTSILLEKQHRLSGRSSQSEQGASATQETHVFLDYPTGELYVWDEGSGFELPSRELDARLGDGTPAERFMVVGDNPALSGYTVTKDDKTVCLDDLAKRIIKPIFDAPGNIG